MASWLQTCARVPFELTRAQPPGDQPPSGRVTQAAAIDQSKYAWHLSCEGKMLVLRITVTIFAWTPSENESIGTTSGLDQYHLMKTKYTRFFSLGQKHVFACGLVTVPQFHTSASDSLGWGGVGWGGMITSLAFPHDLNATLYDLHWQVHMILMLRSMIFIGKSTWS